MAIHETTITESLNKFFNDAPEYIRRVVVNYLLKESNNISFDDFNRFNQQGYYLGKSSRKEPDFVFQGTNALVFIEVKINNDPLTDAQKGFDVEDGECYVGMLAKAPESKKDYIFLVPSWYSHKVDIPKGAKIINWKDLIKYIRDNEYDNQILNHILDLVGDYSDGKIASDNDMKKIPFQLRESLEWLELITNRLKKIVDESIIGKYKGITNHYAWNDKDHIENIDLKNELTIYAGVDYAKKRWTSIDWVENMNHLIIHASDKLACKQNNVAKEYGLDKYAYLVEGVTIDSPVDDVIAAINKMLEKKEK